MDLEGSLSEKNMVKGQQMILGVCVEKRADQPLGKSSM